MGKSYGEGRQCPFVPGASPRVTSKDPRVLPITAEHCFKFSGMLPSTGFPTHGFDCFGPGSTGVKGQGVYLLTHPPLLQLHQLLPKDPPSWVESTSAFFFLGHVASTARGNKGPERNAQDVTYGFDKSTRTHSSTTCGPFQSDLPRRPLTFWETPTVGQP